MRDPTSPPPPPPREGIREDLQYYLQVHSDSQHVQRVGLCMYTRAAIILENDANPRPQGLELTELALKPVTLVTIHGVLIIPDV